MAEYINKQTKRRYIGVFSEDKKECMLVDKIDNNLTPLTIDRKTLIKEYEPVIHSLK